jgi:hypothetical protein
MARLLGIRVGDPPIIDDAFGPDDFYTGFDLKNANRKYRRKFINDD